MQSELEPVLVLIFIFVVLAFTWGDIGEHIGRNSKHNSSCLKHNFVIVIQELAGGLSGLHSEKQPC